MKVIYRYPINMHRAAEQGGAIEIEMPLGSRILHVAPQDRAPFEPSIWALVDPNREPVSRRFEIHGTGIPSDAFPTDHVATWQQQGYVWHLFEVA
jgi:hypothetical protein